MRVILKKTCEEIEDDIQLDARYYQGYTQAELDDMVKMAYLMTNNWVV